MKDWGPAEFARRSGDFVRQAIDSSRGWLTIERSEGLDGLGELYDAVRTGSLPADRGLVIAP
jgi:hypothetical protein